MIHLSDDDRRRAFAAWLRTGRLPLVLRGDGLQLKFNPWHDPADGRFTFVGSGQYFGAGAAGRTDAGERTSRVVKRRESSKLPVETRLPSTVRGAERVPAESRASAFLDAARRSQQQRVAASVPRPENRPNPTVEFASGAVEGLSDTALGAVRGTYSLLTTNPATTVRDAGRAVAGTIDAAIAAEDVPALIQMSRAADAIARASAHDLGRAVGSTIGNVALAVAPEATLSKVSALRRLREEGPRGITYDPLQVGWAKENLGKDSTAKLYNDTATGARPNQAPTLMRTMPDGSKRPVKFDGIQGEYFIDRKWSVRDLPRARAQLLRQSDVLAQHRLIGVWEVPNQAQKIKAIKMLKKMNVTNIKVRVVKP